MMLGDFLGSPRLHTFNAEVQVRSLVGVLRSHRPQCAAKSTPMTAKQSLVVSPVPPHLLVVLWEILALGLRHGLPSEVFIRMHILALDWGFQEARFHGKECYKPALLLSPLDPPNNWICSMCQFPWCKYPHCGWLQAASTEWELGRDTHIQHS